MFIWRSISSVRRRALLLALLPLFSLATLFTPFFAQTASAVSADEVLNSARAWSILNAVIDERGKVDSTISTADANNCHIFGDADNNKIKVGSHVTGNNTDSNVSSFDGATWQKLEDNTGPASSALSAVGIAGGCRGLLEKIGYTFVNGNLEQPSDFGDKLSERIRSALKPNAFFGANIGDGGPGDAISYAILYYNLRSVCGWEYRNALDSTSSTDTSRSAEARSNGWGGDKDDAHFFTYTYDGGRAAENVYYKGGGSTGDIYVGSKSGFAPSGNNDAQLDCGDNNGDTFGAKLADNHRFADAFAALIKPGGATTPGTCLDRYANNPADLAACDAGFKNKSNPAYCTATYPAGSPGAAQLAACQYGLGTATGGANVTTPPPGGIADDTAKEKTKCAVLGIGWIVCPIMNFLSLIVDAAYKFVSSLLFVQPLLTTGASEGVFNAWSTMRNFANITFVIAFLVIIFSQLTSAGITNYGIKKMLPKLVVAAILVNVSYWICAICVDVSNILGGSINGLLKGIGENSIVAGPNASQFGATGENWAGLTAFILAGGLATTAMLYIGLSALLPALISVLVAIIVTFVILTIRQGMIILLIVVSPLAFAAYLLPNTESLFKKWRSLFQVFLIMYPIISLIFGASALASVVVMNSATGDYKIAIQIMGAVIAILPLIVVPTLIKAATGVLNKIGLGGFVSGINLNGLKKSAEDFRGRQEGRRELNARNGGNNLALGKYNRRAKREAIDAGIKSELGRSRNRYIADEALNNESFRNRLAGGRTLGADASDDALQRALAGAKFTIEKVEADEVKAHHATIDNMDASQLQNIIANSKSDTEVAAAIERLVAVGSTKDVGAVVDKYGSNGKNDIINKTLANSLRDNGPGFLKASNIDNIGRGQSTGTMSSIASKNIEDGVYSQEKLVAANSSELAYASHNTTAQGQYNMGVTAGQVKANPVLSGKIKHNRSEIDDLEANGVTTLLP